MPPPSRAEKQTIYLYYPKTVFLTTKTNNSFNKHALSGHYGLGTFPSARATAGNKLHGLHVLSGQNQTKSIND